MVSITPTSGWEWRRNYHEKQLIEWILFLLAFYYLFSMGRFFFFCPNPEGTIIVPWLTLNPSEPSTIFLIRFVPEVWSKCKRVTFLTSETKWPASRCSLAGGTILSKEDFWKYIQSPKVPGKFFWSTQWEISDSHIFFPLFHKPSLKC